MDEQVRAPTYFCLDYPVMTQQFSNNQGLGMYPSLDWQTLGRHR